MRSRLWVCLLCLCPMPAQQPGGAPLTASYADGAAFRWLNKPVLASRMLDEMESLASWTFRGNGSMALAASPAKQGKFSLHLRSTASEAATGAEGNWIDLMATRKFNGEDWSAFNRLSLWVYPDVDGAPALSCTLLLHNDGVHKLPDRYNEGRNESIPLRNREWNHVVWEIEPLDRDRVTAVDFAYSLPKKHPDPGDRTELYIDALELQKVKADHVEGWDVATGRIALSGSGFGAGASKSALASDLAATEFSVIRQDTGEVALTAPVKTVTTPLGSYQTLEFSAVRTPGEYVIRAGADVTRPFRIGDDAWRPSIEKAANFFYSERCGTVIPGIHGICHQDCYTEHAGKRLLVNGGYHDAGDLSATGHTPGASYAFFSLARRLREQNLDPELQNRLIEEATWGMNWVLKTRFGDGYRSTGQLISYWTDGVMGDDDDRHGEAVNDPEWNFRVSGLEALAYRVIKESDPELALRSLATAKEDWTFAVAGLQVAAPIPAVYGQKDELERNSIGALASVDLFEATGDRRYADEAFALAQRIMNSQERKLQPWSLPMTGFFYSNERKESLFQRFHTGEEQAPVMALARLCEIFPEHPDWMRWYAAVTLHSKYYLERAAEVNLPYGVLPAAVYRESDAKLVSGKQGWTPLRAADEQAFVEEVRAGVPLGGGAYLRRFPVWFDFRGNFGVLLSQAKALATAARLRGDLAGMDLAEKQPEWVLGRNPFAASIMYGEGYDWTPLYSVRSGQMVGALPVGIETKGFHDAPYWPNQIGWTYKEVWTHSVSRWVWLMEDVAGSAVVSGTADPSGGPIAFREVRYGDVTSVSVDASGGFRLTLPEGMYEARQGNAMSRITVLPAGVFHMDLRPDRVLSFETAGETKPGSREVTVRVDVQGAGAHWFSLRTSNLEGSNAVKRVDLRGGEKARLEWRAQVQDRETPWVAVVTADGSPGNRQEVSGIAK